jgi:hypothetical protein
VNETNSTNAESESDLSAWSSWPPEDVLHAILSELMNPLALMKANVQILSTESARQFHPKAAKNILKTVDKLERMRKEAVAYLNAYQAKSQK